MGLGGAQRGEGGWDKAGQGRLGQDGAGWSGAPPSPSAIRSKKCGPAAFASVDFCVSLKRGAAAVPELMATECLRPGFPELQPVHKRQEKEQAWDVDLSPLEGSPVQARSISLRK